MHDFHLHKPLQHPELHPEPVTSIVSAQERAAYYEACRKHLCERFEDEVLGTFLAKRVAAQARKLRSRALVGWQIAEVMSKPKEAEAQVLAGRVTVYDRVHWGKRLTFHQADGAIREFIFAFFEPD